MTPSPRAPRLTRPRRYVMCSPDHFAVEYAINPWMTAGQPVDVPLAVRQWQTLRGVFQALGHDVQVLSAVPGLPDMVFAANGALVVGERAYGARFRFPERADEAPAHRRWLTAAGVEHVEPVHHNEGEGDFLVVGDLVLAGTGFRTDPAAHAEAADVLGLPVVSLQLVDPRFYHLDTALGVLDGDTREVAYYPGAFSDESLRVLRELFPDAILATEQDALVLGLNVVGDGRQVVLPAAATALAAQVAERGFEPVPVDLSELLKAGGSVKCCTMELHRLPVRTTDPASLPVAQTGVPALGTPSLGTPARGTPSLGTTAGSDLDGAGVA